jgi:signal transduction histidine kinase
MLKGGARRAGDGEAVDRLEALFADAPVAFQVFGADGHCEHCNAAFRELFGAEPPPDYSVFTDEFAIRYGYLGLIRRAFRGETTRIPPAWYDPRDLTQVAVPEGRRVAVEAVAVPLAGEGGTVEHVAFIFADKTAELERRDAQHLMSDRLASLGTLAAGAAHEINNPLASLVANLAVATRELSAPPHEQEPAGDRTERALECLHDASEATNRIRLVVGDLRLFSRIDQEQSGSVDLCAVLDSSARLASIEIRHRARLVKNYQNVSLVRGGEVRLGQVFLNLLINAAQAIPEGHPDDHEVCVSAISRDADHVVVEVRDTGVGIAPENQARIFEPFFTTKAASKGTGLGLAICRKIVTAYGGSIDVESEVGKGSIFRVTLSTRLESPVTK